MGASNLPPGVTQEEIDGPVRSVEDIDAWCENCGEYRILEGYTDCDPNEIVEGNEVCIMCGGRMVVDEPKLDIQRIE